MKMVSGVRLRGLGFWFLCGLESSEGVGEGIEAT